MEVPYIYATNNMPQPEPKPAEPVVTEPTKTIDNSLQMKPGETPEQYFARNPITDPQNLTKPTNQSVADFVSGLPTTDTAPQSSVVGTSTAIDTQKANDEQVKADEQKAKDEEIANLTRDKKIKDLKTSLGIDNKPTTPDLVELYKGLRTDTGVGTIEEELNTIKAQKSELQANFQKYKTGAHGGVTAGFATGTINEEAQKIQDQLDSLTRQEQVAVDKLNAKNSYVSAIMDWTQKKYAIVSQEFDSNFTKNLQIIALVNSEITDEQKNASAYLNTVYNMAKESGTNINSLDATTKAEINKAELKAGLPIGTYEALATFSPESKIIGSVVKTLDNNGNEVWQMLTTDASGKIVPVNIQTSTASNVSKPSVNINIFGIKATSTTQALGGTDSGVTAKDGGTFLASQGVQGDTAIAQKLLTSSIYSDLTVDQAMKKWSNGGYGYEQGQALDPQALIKDLPQSQVNTLLDYIKTKEGISTAQPTAQYSDLLDGKTQAQQDFFNGLGANEKSNVYQIITGKALISDLAAGMGGAAARQRLLAEAQRIDPAFSENVNKRRYQFQTAWFNPTAVPFKTRTSINTAMGHVAQLKTDADAIGNDTIQKYNSIKNMLEKETGNDAVTNFNYTLTQVASEIASAYKNGTAPTDQEVEQERAALAYNFSPKQFQGVFDRAAKLLSSKITSMSEEYQGAMGKYPDEPIVQDFALREMQAAGIDMTPIIDSLKRQGYDVSGYKNNSVNSNSGKTSSGLKYIIEP